MNTDSLRINQLSKDAYTKYLAYLEAIDNKDIEAYGKFLSDNISVQFNNDPPTAGRQIVLQGLGGFWQSFKSIEHDLLNIYGNDKNYVLEAFNHYVKHDGNKVSLRAVAFTDLDDSGLVESVRIYHDTGPLFSD